MKRPGCLQEENVFEAVRTGIWKDDLAAHADRCDACREIVRTSQWMRALAQTSGETPSLPDAGLLWWRAHLFEKQARIERARELQEWMEIISVTVIAAGLAVWTGWNWMTIQAMFSSLLTEPWPLLWTDAVATMSSTPLAVTVSVVIFSVVAIALGYPMLVQD